MQRFNKGVIYTNDNCIGCNRCISQCAISGANVSVIEYGKTKIQVDSVKCNHCGKCISLCIHNARDYLDDCDAFFNDLNNGEKISIIVAPSFYALYPDDGPRILGYLKRLGVEHIYDASFGAEICVWGHVKYLKDHRNDPVESRAFISQSCPALINVIEMYHPELFTKIIPIHSPMMCTAIYAHKYLGDKNKIAFLGPCISKKDEIITPNTHNEVSYNVTFAHLMKHLDFQNLGYDEVKAEITSNYLCSLFPRVGTFKETVAAFFPNNENIIGITTMAKETFQTLNVCLGKKYPEAQPLMAEVMACKLGCYHGPGIESYRFDEERITALVSSKHKKLFTGNIGEQTYEERWEFFCNMMKDIKYEDFTREFEDRFKQPFHVPESVLNSIFDEMLKNTDEKRTINCSSCGYSSCHEMAKAIAYGYNRKENCIHYMQDEMLARFYTDKETGLPNRQRFMETLVSKIKKNPETQYVLMCGDVNRLKVVNDVYSYSVGNKVLKRIAEQLRMNSPDNGIVARLGGGAFALFMEYNPDNMQRIYNLRQFDCADLGVKFPITIRFGVYIRQSNENDIDSMMNCATLCMDTSVSITQNTFALFTKEYRERMLFESEVTTKMQPALDNGEFHLWFQPQYKVGSGELIGAETLCRWIKEDGTMVSPGVFIPLSEKNGFIRTLDKHIWRTAFATMRKWLDKGLKPVPISINISRVSLENDALIFIIKRMDDEFKIPKEYIHFEITESAYMDDQQNMLYRINEIRKLGFQIAMDDFGSGYSSLNSLKDIPIDILKLDMGFMRSSTNMDKGGVIISSVLKMAKALKLTTVAEGVESEDQASFLEGEGCDVIQGFLYAKPMPEGKFEDLIKNT